MTKDRNFKRLVRERMASTGERYSTARAQVLSKRLSPASEADHHERAFPGVRAVGGQQPDLASARNLCTNAGINGPDGQPMSEALAFGLAGGIGFLYGVFEYADGPTMTIVARNRSMPDPFCEPLFARAGARAEIATTSGAKKAATTLDRAIADERPALCTVGSAALPYLGTTESMAGSAPHVVGVVGTDSDGRLLLDDRSPEPIVIERSVFDRARADYRQAKHRMITIGAVDANHDWHSAIREAVSDGAVGFDTPPAPQFAANVGVAGLTKFQRLLTDDKDPKGWPRVFGSGRRAAIGLSRLYDCIEHAYTSPAGGRSLYAEFLHGARALVESDGWAEAAGHIEASARSWAKIAEAAVEAHPTLSRFAALADERATQLDGVPDPRAMAEAADAQSTLVENCDISAADARATFERVARLMSEVVDQEAAALAILREDRIVQEHRPDADG